MRTHGHRVLITGGSSGIGAILAEHMLAAGNEVIVCARDSGKLDQLKERLPGVRIEVCDVTERDQIEQMRQRVGGVTLLFNNASITQELSFVDAPDLARQEEEIRINLIGTLNVLDVFLPGMLLTEEAAVINVTSALAFVPEAVRPIYSATKAAQHSLTQSLRRQLRDTGVRVFELIPPLTDTPMAAHVIGIPKLAPEKLARALLRGLAADRFEIAPGLSWITRIMSRLAPAFTFSKLNS